MSGSLREDPSCAVVIATKDRRDRLLATLERLSSLPERPQIVVVDNGSTDGTAEAVERTFPSVRVTALPSNLGGAARTVGARSVSARYVAFSDDDSWWAPGSIGRAVALLERYPSLAVVAARILVGGDGARTDPTSRWMAASPLRHRHDAPGAAILGFLACGAVVRRAAFLDAGGFWPQFGIGGEEEVLALDLASAGWDLAYVPDVVAYHEPEPSRDATARRRTQTRNALWSAWLRRPIAGALRRSVRIASAAHRDRAVRSALADAARGIPWVVPARRVVPPEIERSIRVLECEQSAATHRARRRRGLPEEAAG